MKIIAIALLSAAAVTFASCTSYADSDSDGSGANNGSVAREPDPNAAEVDRPGRASDHDHDEDVFRGGFIGGVGFPRPLAIEGLLKFDRFVSVGLEYSLLPATNFGAVEAHFWGIAADLRIFPWRGAFFIGLRAGRQFMSASASSTTNEVTTSERVSADTWFINPRMGVLYTFKSGFTLGIDAGIQLPVNTSRTSTLPDTTASDVSSTIASVENTLGAGVTPTIDLLRIGFLF